MVLAQAPLRLALERNPAGFGLINPGFKQLQDREELTKHPVGGYDSISYWGAHIKICPLSPTICRKPFGNAASQFKPWTNPGRTAHQNGWSLLASPQAISRNLDSFTAAMLPKLT
ncbi:unnamed protein product [Dovyalis caffra]|uniref:Uncharacterized protein n=1 Tax=Dovyalis caffra TaxID=77055 RepID=A0AAV1QZS9_9ROSI|nr:unnamed protein product [Dovyalis caffra]